MLEPPVARRQEGIRPGSGELLDYWGQSPPQGGRGDTHMRSRVVLVLVAAMLVSGTGAALADPLVADASRVQSLNYHYDRLIVDGQSAPTAYVMTDLTVSIVTKAGGVVASAAGYVEKIPLTPEGGRESYYFQRQALHIADVVATPAGNSWSIHTTLVDQDGVSRTLDLELMRPKKTQLLTPNLQSPGANAWVDPAGAAAASWTPMSGIQRSEYVATGQIAGFDLSNAATTNCACIGGAVSAYDGLAIEANVSVG